MSDAQIQQRESSRIPNYLQTTEEAKALNPSKRKPAVPIEHWEKTLVGKKLVRKDAPDDENVSLAMPIEL